MFQIALINGQTWLICGGRAFSDQVMFDGVMSQLIEARGCPAKIVHGGATGADSMAHNWARRKDIEVVSRPANWSAEGLAAGPLRNQRMLDEEKPDFVVAFPGKRGTADMVRRAKAAGLDVAEVQDVTE